MEWTAAGLGEEIWAIVLEEFTDASGVPLGVTTAAADGGFDEFVEFRLSFASSSPTRA